MSEHEQMLTPQEAGRRFGVTDRTVKRWIEQGKLRGYRPGRAYQVPESAVEELLERSEIRPKAPEPFSLEWARAATDAEFYRAVVEAPEKDIDRLDMLSGLLVQLTNWELREAFAESRDRVKAPAPEGRPDVTPVGPKEWPMLRERAKAVTKEVNRRRPPLYWIQHSDSGNVVKWNIPPEERDQYRERIEKEFCGEPYTEEDVRSDVPAYKEPLLNA